MYLPRLVLRVVRWIHIELQRNRGAENDGVIESRFQALVKLDPDSVGAYAILSVSREQDEPGRQSRELKESVPARALRGEELAEAPHRGSAPRNRSRPLQPKLHVSPEGAAVRILGAPYQGCASYRRHRSEVQLLAMLQAEIPEVLPRETVGLES